MFQGISCIVQGADHINRNQICQDAAGVFCNENYALAVVADGHGSPKYLRSEIGSRYVVESVHETIDIYMKDFNKFSKSIMITRDYLTEKMKEQIFARWCSKIEDYHLENPLTKDEIEVLKKENAVNQEIYSYYGSTVLFAVMTQDYHFGMLIGDGGFIIVNDNGVAETALEDENSFANYCSSICSRNSIEAFRSYFRLGKPISIILSTDGLIKSFASEEDFKDYHLLLSSMLEEPKSCKERLEKNLEIRTHSGSGDDISVAAIYNTVTLSMVETKSLLKQSIEAGNKRRTAENNEVEEKGMDSILKCLKKGR